MGMTIDNSIAILVDYLEWQKLHEMDGTGIDEATRNLIGVARKYQKIEEVVNNWHHDIDAKDFECMAKIAEVVEDGNDST